MKQNHKHKQLKHYQFEQLGFSLATFGSYLFLVVLLRPLFRIILLPFESQNALPPVGNWQRDVYELLANGGADVLLGVLILYSGLLYLSVLRCVEDISKVSLIYIISNLLMPFWLPIWLMPAFLISGWGHELIQEPAYWQQYTDYRTQWIPIFSFCGGVIILSQLQCYIVNWFNLKVDLCRPF